MYCRIVYKIFTKLFKICIQNMNRPGQVVPIVNWFRHTTIFLPNLTFMHFPKIIFIIF